jgi:hypothetical protein
MKRKKRRRVPKVPDGTPDWGTVPLGQDPPFGQWDIRSLRNGRSRPWKRARQDPPHDD